MCWTSYRERDMREEAREREEEARRFDVEAEEQLEERAPAEEPERELVRS